ncbi:MAG: hypothetical protein ACK2UO_13435 [Caldilineaceae bacterium]
MIEPPFNRAGFSANPTWSAVNMGKSSKSDARRQVQFERAEYHRRLNSLYGHDNLQRNVFGRRVALPSEIARQVQHAQRRSEL